MSRENDLSGIVLDVAIRIHRKLGSGLLESVYEQVLAHELSRLGYRVVCQQAIEIEYDELRIQNAFRADLIVDDLLIIEVKSIEEILPVHKKQLFTYLKLTNRKLGLLINFGSPLLKDGYHRIVNGLQE